MKKIIFLFCAALILLSGCGETANQKPDSAQETQSAAQSAIEQQPNALSQSSTLTYGSLSVITTPHLGFIKYAESDGCFTFMYDFNLQQVKPLCNIAGCEHKDAACGSYISSPSTVSRIAVYPANDYLVCIADSDKGKIIYRFSYDTCAKTKNMLALSDDMKNVYFNNAVYSGFAYDGDILYSSYEKEDGSSGIISINTLTGEVQSLMQYDAYAGIKDVCGNALVTFRWSDKRGNYDPASPDATFCIYEAVPVDGSQISELFLMPLNSNIVYTDGKGHGIYYSSLNTTRNGSTGITTYAADGVIYRKDMISGETVKTAELPMGSNNYLDIKNIVNGSMIVYLSNDTGGAFYKIDIESGSAEPFSLAAPDGAAAVDSAANTLSNVGDNMIVVSYGAQNTKLQAYTISKSDFISGIPNYSRLEFSQEIWN